MSLKEIARIVGVDQSTVSRALRNSPRVKDSTKRRIVETARKLNYLPNDLARGLVVKRTNTIGLLVPDLRTSFYPEIIYAVEDAARKGGYCLLLGKSDFDSAKVSEYINVFRRRQVDGIILSTVRNASDLEEVQRLRQDEIPFVLIDTPDKNIVGLSANIVSVDIEEGACKAVQHLVDLGHRRIGYISSWQVTDLRFIGYRRSLENNGIEYDENLVVQAPDMDEISGYEAMLRLLELKIPPTAVFAANDGIAIGAMTSARDVGKRIPEDIAFVGFDDIKVASFFEVPLTTVRQPKHEIGEAAVELLIKSMEQGPKMEPRRVEFQPELVIRESSGGPVRRAED